MRILTIITDFGDLAVLLPICAVILVWLLLRSANVAAVWWLVALAICIGGTAGLKILFVICPPNAALQSPSGHTSLGALVYGALSVFVAAQRGSRWRFAIVAGCVLLVGAIAATRVILSAHTLVETLLGLAIGAAALAVFARAYFRMAVSEMPLRPLLFAVALVVVVLHGSQLRAEGLLRASGIHLESDGIACS